MYKNDNHSVTILVADLWKINFDKYDNGKENVHYTFNQTSKLKALINMTENIVKKFNAENMFKAEQSY